MWNIIADLRLNFSADFADYFLMRNVSCAAMNLSKANGSWLALVYDVGTYYQNSYPNYNFI
jgi:hypothetical protein